jgi:hypothetical protein
MNRIVTAVAALTLTSCAVGPLPACQSKETIFEHIGAGLEGGKSQVLWQAGETLGWKFTGVKDTAPFRRAGYKDDDLLARVCGLSIDRFAKAEGEICCSPDNGRVTFTFTRPDGSSYEVST